MGRQGRPDAGAGESAARRVTRRCEPTMAPTSAESAWAVVAKNAGHDHWRRRRGRAGPCRCATEAIVLVVRRAASLWLRRSWSSWCRACLTAGNSGSSYFLLSVRYVTKWGYKELQILNN